jgi:hypothetical protein
VAALDAVIAASVPLLVRSEAMHIDEKRWSFIVAAFGSRTMHYFELIA